MTVSKLPRSRRIPRNWISAEKPSEGRARTPWHPQVSRRRGGLVARRRRGEKERGESGGEAQSGERAVARHRAGRERWQGTKRWEGVGFYKARRTPCAKTSARPAAFSRARAILSRRLCYLSGISPLFSTVIFILYLIFNIYLYFSTVYFFLYTLFSSNRPSDLYLTDRKETNGNFAKRYPYPSPDLQIRHSLVHPFLPQDKLLIQMHLDACNAWASC